MLPLSGLTTSQPLFPEGPSAWLKAQPQTELNLPLIG